MNSWTKLKPYLLRAGGIALFVITLLSFAGWAKAQPVREPLSEIVIDGPAKGLVNVNYTFTATIHSSTFTPPITYTWEASDQLPEVICADVFSSTKTFKWDVTGTKFITVTASNGEHVVVTDTVEFEVDPHIAYLPTIFRGWPPIPSPMDLYAHVDDAFHHFLSSDRGAGDQVARAIYHTYPDFREAEFSMPLSSDIVGTQYAYSISASENDTGSYPPATCDVEILLRRDGNDTILASWSRAFTVDSTTRTYTGDMTGPDPDAQAGDTLVLRIRANDGSAMIWLRSAGYSSIQVPGYTP